MPIELFAAPSTRDKLAAARRPSVLLVGGFNGYWNFGDVLQLQGTIAWYRQHLPTALILPFMDLLSITSHAQLPRLELAFGVSDFIFYAHDPSATRGDAAASLVLLDAPSVDAAVPGSVLHVYGGGFLNQYWGAAMVEVMEAALGRWQPDSYIISGQQVGREFAERLARHCATFQPNLVGCRDPVSAAALQAHGVMARLSADDASDVLSHVARLTTSPAPVPFGIHVNLTRYVYTVDDRPAAEERRLLLERLDGDLTALAARWGTAVEPLVLGASADPAEGTLDGLSALKTVGFVRHFPLMRHVDLVELLVRGDLQSIADQVSGCGRVVSSSYHVALLAMHLDVPAMLVAANPYYRQKQAGLGGSWGSVEGFLDADVASVVAKQRQTLAAMRRDRARWAADVRRVVGTRRARTSRRRRDGAALEHARREVASCGAALERLIARSSDHQRLLAGAGAQGPVGGARRRMSRLDDLAESADGLAADAGELLALGVRMKDLARAVAATAARGQAEAARPPRRTRAQHTGGSSAAASG